MNDEGMIESRGKFMSLATWTFAFILCIINTMHFQAPTDRHTVTLISYRNGMDDFILFHNS